MEENNVVNTENEEVLETQTTVEEPIVEEVETAESTATSDASSEEETPIEKVEGEEVTEGEEGGSKMDAGAVEALGTMMGGLAETYNAQQKTQENLSKTLETQKEIFEAFDNNINILSESIQNIDKTVTELQASLTATKMYTQLLSKAILVSDIVMIVAIILLAIFK